MQTNDRIGNVLPQLIIQSWEAPKFNYFNKQNLTGKDKSFKFKHRLQCPCVTKVLKQNIIQVMAENAQQGKKGKMSMKRSTDILLLYK